MMSFEEQRATVLLVYTMMAGPATHLPRVMMYHTFRYIIAGVQALQHVQ